VLSLDEVYFDVTKNKTSLPTATLVARTIRDQIHQELTVTASAGVAPNKFLAKLTSDWRKPDGIFVIINLRRGHFEQDVPLAETDPMIQHLAEKLWSASCKESRPAHTVLKLKTSEFKILTRSHTPDLPPSPCQDFGGHCPEAAKKVDLGSNERYPLVGVGLSNFERLSKRPRSHLFSSNGQ
jgi:hypothetical protein